MEFKGTKGVWEILKLDDKETTSLFIESNGRVIGTAWKNSGIEKEANAQLIATAPKLLEMLQLTVIELESGAKGHWEITGMIKELIQQATKID